MSEKNIDSFCIDHEENYLFAINKVGEILTVKVDTLEVVSRTQAHNGSVNGIAIHPKHNYLAALGNDGYLSISKIVNNIEVKVMHMVKIRDIKPDFDFYKKGPSTSQAVTFHPEKLRIASRGGSAGIFELEFDEHNFKVLHCLRAHDNHDPFTVCYLGDGDKLISGSNTGGGTTLSENGIILNKWYHRSAIHWYEQLGEGVFLVASDAMKVLRMNFKNDKENIDGPEISIDHLEHVTYNNKTKRAFTSAFDRNICEIDPITCEKIKVIWKAPFKCRWIKTLERDPNILLAQCRNGGIYKIDIAKGKTISVLKETQLAQWSAVINDEEIIVAGEGDFYSSYKPANIDNYFLITKYNVTKKNLTSDNYTYTKRVASSNGTIVFGRTSGELVIIDKNKTVRSCLLPGAIRDLEFFGDDQIFVACENGCLYQVELHNLNISTLHQSKSPLWALAFNPVKKIIAFADRNNQLYYMDMVSKKIVKWVSQFSFVKRMKWKDQDTILFTGGSNLFSANLNSDKKKLVCAFQNTIEDFAWDINKRYLVIASYTRYLYLCDFDSGEVLHQAGDKADYSKGILFLDNKVNPTGYQADFITIGRSGIPSYNRIHDDRIISYGFINKLENYHD